MNKEGFWVKYWMESGRGHPTIDETYIFYKYKDGYIEKDTDIFSDDAYSWAGHDMGGFDMIRFKSDYKVVEKPSVDWIVDELIRTYEEMANLSEHIIRLTKYRKI